MVKRSLLPVGFLGFALAVGFVWQGCTTDTSVRTKQLLSIQIEPGDVTLNIENDVMVAQTYTAKGTYGDGHVADLTDKVTFSLSPSTLGSFDGATFTSSTTNGGLAEVRATLDDVFGSAKLTITYKKNFNNTADGSVPDNAAELFATAESKVVAARKPRIIYPSDKVILPPNLGVIELHWRRGANNTLFEVSFANSISTIKGYTRCKRKESVLTDGCIWSLTPEQWRYIANTNRGAEPVNVQIRATDDSGTGIGVSDVQTMEFAKDSIEGGVYYWANNRVGDNTTSTILRFDFGSPDKPSTPAFPKEVIKNKSAQCVGCHVVSPDGNHMAARSLSGAGGYLLYDFRINDPIKAAVVNETNPVTNAVEIWMASFSPDGNQLIASLKGARKLFLYKTDCDATNPGPCMTPTEVSTGNFYLPDPAWAPDGTRIAATEGRNRSSSVVDGRIVYMDVTAGGFGAVQEWVPRAAGYNRCSPGFTPDSSAIVFTEDKCEPTPENPWGNCECYSDSSAKLRMVARDSHKPVTLSNANAKGPLDSSTELMNTYGRLSPFSSKYKTFDNDEQVFWLTFSTRRAPGLRPIPPGFAPGDRNGDDEDDYGYGSAAYLWMVAIRPSELAAGRDPSATPFLLPFQDLSYSNHMAEWTKKVVVPIAQ